jgi:hypothetical protein
VIALFCGIFLFRGKPSCPKPPACEAVEDETRLSAAGPMEVTTAGDAGSSRPTADTGSGERPAKDAEPAGEAAASDAVPASEEATVPEEPDAAPSPADAGRAEERDAGASRAEDRAGAPRDTGRVSGEDTTRPTPAEATPPRTDTGGGGTDDVARANELVTQGDQALAARNLSGARSAYEEALGLQPNNNRAKIGLGRVAFQEGDFEEAVRWLEPIYRNQGNMDLGAAYVRLGRLQDAKTQFEKLLERNPNNASAQSALDAVNRQLGQ